MHNADLTEVGCWWRAVLELGPRAALAGVSALRYEGIELASDGNVHVLVPKGAAPHAVPGVTAHESRRFRERDVLCSGLRRTRPATSAVHAAPWARTDREALLMLTVVVQQRRATPADVAEAVSLVRRHARRSLLSDAVADLEGGVRSMGELDVTRSMRSRGLPEPVRQAVRRRASGVQYLDADFPDYSLSLEIDGAQHQQPEQALADCVRDLDLGAEGRTVARIPLIAWRLDQDAVLDGLERLFRARGWRP